MLFGDSKDDIDLKNVTLIVTLCNAGCNAIEKRRIEKNRKE